MLRLGSFEGKKQQKKTVPFREWVKSGNAKEGKYLITYLFAPSMYPTGMLIFETENERVKFSIRSDLWESVKQTLGLKGSNIYDVEFYFVIANNEYGLERYSFSSDVFRAVYEFDKSKKYWKHSYLAIAPSNDEVEI
jgi:hypothetical protein